MVILRPDNTTHSITIIPRKNAGNITIVIKNESKVSTEIIEDISTTYSNGYLTFEFDLSVSEQDTFEYEVFAYGALTADTTLYSADSTILSADMTSLLGTELLFRGKALATNKTI